MTTFEQEQSEFSKARQATPITVDFTNVMLLRQHKSGKIRDRGNAIDYRPTDADGKLLTPKQIRARARRRMKHKKYQTKGVITEQEFEALYKPIEDWDLEELARGRPRNADGKFRGPAPAWITREVYEKSMEQFTAAIKTEMGAQSITALDTMRYLLDNEDVDNRGKPIIPPSVKWQVSSFLLEHIVGKPKQHIQQDISVKLQGILGSVMVNPNQALAPPSQGGQDNLLELDVPSYALAHLPGHTMPLGTDDILDAEWTEEETG